MYATTTRKPAALELIVSLSLLPVVIAGRLLGAESTSGAIARVAMVVGVVYVGYAAVTGVSSAIVEPAVPATQLVQLVAAK